MLKAYGDGYILPDNVPANEFLNLEGNKISTSRNWAVWLHEYLIDFPGQQDVLRYVLCANAPETKDNDFTWKDFQTRNNSELVAIFGNFVNRAVVLTHKYFGGVVPQDKKPEAIDKETLVQIVPIKKSIEDYIEHYKFREALKEAMNLARLGNKYLTDTEPWKVAKEDMDRVASILNVSLQICANLAIVFAPFLPFSAKKLNHILNVEALKSENNVKTSKLNDGKLTWEQLGSGSILPAGHKLNQAELLFSKVEDDTIDAQIAKLNATKAANEATEVGKKTADVSVSDGQSTGAESLRIAIAKEECTYDEFMKMDIRTATVLEAEKVPKTDKLLKLTIDTGIDIRVIVSGIAEYYIPKELIGKQICILANLQPRKIKGIESKGMILMAKEEDGKMRIVSPEERLQNGAVLS
jgi:methionyl-tRNA synthetase